MKLFKKLAYLSAFLVCLIPYFSSAAALAIGIGLGLLIENPFRPGLTKKTQTLLLQGSIVALGAGMNVVEVLKVGYHSIPATLIGLVAIMFFGMFLFKWFGISQNLGTLLSAGTAICGGSAIAAVSPVIKASDRETGLALGMVFLLNAIGLIVFPFLGHALGMSETSFGAFAALAIHDTSSVVGAAAQYGSVALGVATTTKLVRALWIMPLTMGIVFLNRKSGDKRAKFPVFILLFLAMSLLSTWIQVPYVYEWGKRGLVAAIFLIGTGFQIDAIKSIGAKVVISSLILWIFSIGLAYVQVRVF